MDRLPAELVLAIAVHISNVRDRLDLLLICRHWRAVLFDVVYENLRINTHQASQLVETLLERPHLATLIQSVTVLESHERFASQNPLSRNVQALLNEIAEGPQEIEDWNEELLHAEKDAWIALLLALIPKIRSLSWDGSLPSPWVTVMASKAAMKDPPFDTRPALQHLETVEVLNIQPDDPSTCTPYFQVVPFFHLPSMNSIILENIRDFGPYEADLSLLHCNQRATDAASGTSPIQTLDLTGCNLGGGVARFIRSCSNLKKFVYQHENEIDDGIHRDFRPRIFYDILSSQKHSLEVLHLNNLGQGSYGLDDTWEEDEVEPADRWLGSFAAFRKLWDLRLRVQNLLNLHPEDRNDVIVLKDMLPRNLKWLHLTNCDEEHCSVLADGMLDLLHDLKDGFPELEQIYIYSAIAESSQPQPAGPHRPPQDVRVLSTISEQFEPIQTLCDGGGITFELLLHDEYKIVYQG
ncbi:hypothetical protein BJX64DRAFT_47930 [Aspergillus heterothallicus]